MKVGCVAFSAVYINFQLVLLKQEFPQNDGEILWVKMNSSIPEVYKSVRVDEFITSTLLAVAYGKILKTEFCIDNDTYTAETPAAIAFLLQESSRAQHSLGPGHMTEEIIEEIMAAILGDDFDLDDLFEEK